MITPKISEIKIKRYRDLPNLSVRVRRLKRRQKWKEIGQKMKKESIKAVENKCYKLFKRSQNKPPTLQPPVSASFTQTRTKTSDRTPIRLAAALRNFRK